MPKKPAGTIRIDLLAYIASTNAGFWVYMMNRHLWSYPAIVQAVGILIFTFCWYLMTMGAIALARVRVTRKRPGPEVAETR